MDVHTKGIRVIRVEPGLVRTELPESSYPNAREYYAQREYSPLEAEDIAEDVTYAVEQTPRVSVNDMATYRNSILPSRRFFPGREQCRSTGR